ncbi:MAG TPA: hypothetical protein VLH85_02735 [Levilinea sp.]|nr:hypothetical protein [Levilinea sp.]
MPPPKRKRFSAFNDFPANDAQSAPGDPPTPVDKAAASPAAQAVPQVARIETLKPSQMMPDRFQPRRLLPVSLRPAFFSGEVDCYQAAAQWLALARHDGGYRAEVERLLSMGESFDAHGQIKAITGSWVPASDGNFLFLIETGERRFWAACLRAVEEVRKEEPLLRVEAIEKPTRQRQVLENRHAEPPSAVGMACEIAALILSETNIQPDPDVVDEYEYFRQARAQRMPVGLWDHITPIMQLTRPRMVQLLNILHFPSPLLELADRYRLPERVLREILSLPQSQWERILKTSIQNSLTSEEVVELTGGVQATPAHKKRSPAAVAPGRVALSGLRRFANALVELDDVSQLQALDEVADMLVVTEQAEGMINILHELARLIQARLERR